MVKFGKEIHPFHLTCITHGIHLCVCDILYSKSSVQASVEGEMEGDGDTDDDEEDEEEEEEEEEEGNADIAPKFKGVIEKVRRIVRIFRRSPLRNDDSLQPKLAKEKVLLLDCKTRWNSLLCMLSRFLEAQKEIKMAIIDIGKDFDLTYGDLDKIKELCSVLAPLNWAVQNIEKENTTIVEADDIIAFTRKKLGENGPLISKALLNSFEARVQQRRYPEPIHLMKYLEDLAFKRCRYDQFGVPIKKSDLLQMLLRFLKGYTRKMT